VIEEPLDGVRVVVFELHHCQAGFLHDAHSSACKLENDS
jgi:hypothetical protein